ncbi:MAG: hypothetical protein Q9188_005720 [Gyalolechia gomerana]
MGDTVKGFGGEGDTRADEQRSACNSRFHLAKAGGKAMEGSTPDERVSDEDGGAGGNKASWLLRWPVPHQLGRSQERCELDWVHGPVAKCKIPLHGTIGEKMRARENLREEESYVSHI